MSAHNISNTMEMYLIAILTGGVESADDVLPLSTLAASLGVQPVSANQMVKKLVEDGLVEYQPYQGVRLTETGLAHALRILRHRRLWEVFFVRELGLSLDEADALACDLEHLISTAVADRLDSFLGHPSLCYHGYPIPRKVDETGSLMMDIPLRDLSIGESASVMRIESDKTTRAFLFNEGIRPGASVTLAAIGSRGDLLINTGGKAIHLTDEIASAVMLGKEKPA